MSDYRTMLEVGDRVCQDAPFRTGTVVDIDRAVDMGRSILGGRATFSVRWDDDDRPSRGWLRFALRKIPRGTHAPL